MQVFRVAAWHTKRAGRHSPGRWCNSITGFPCHVGLYGLSPSITRSCSPGRELVRVKAHYFSSSSDANSTKDSESKKYRILYERNAERNTIPRAALGVSVFNTTYWTWYVWDFIPAVNASPIETLHINPTIGLFGVALGLMINSVTMLYPMMLVSKVAFSPADGGRLKVWKHDLPLIRPSSITYSEHELGDIFIDSSSGDARKIVNALDGDLTRFRGHLGISVIDKKLPLLLEIRDEAEVKASNLLFQTLMNHHTLEREDTTKTTTKSRSNQSSRNNRGKGQKIVGGRRR
jgi:hypothetical protein